MRIAWVVVLFLGCDDGVETRYVTDDAGAGETPRGSLEGAGRCAPVLGEGGACDSGADCAEPWVCIDRICRSVSALAGPCTISSHCEADAYCNRHDIETGERLEAGQCASDLLIGAACASLDFGACGGGENSCIRGVCRTESAEGDPCESRSDCGRDLWCDETSAAPDGVGGMCRSYLAPGAECPEDSACGDLRCFDSRCGPRRGEGEPCVSGSHCAAGLYCDRYEEDDPGTRREVRVCRVEAPVGGACDDAEISNCAGGACVGGQCVDDAPEGTPCRSNANCARGLFCQGD